MQIACIVVSTLVLAVVATQDLSQVRLCAEHHNDCHGCMQVPGCGYCGVFNSEGWCIPGNSAGSQIAQYGYDECPSLYWKFGAAGSCDAVIRAVVPREVKSDKITWGTFSVNPNQASANALYDALLFVVSTEPDNKNQTHAGFAVLYGQGHAGQNISQWQFHGVGFISLLEYHNSDSSAFKCSSVSATGPSNCDDFVNVKKTTDLLQWQPLSSTETPYGSVAGGWLFTASATTTDNVFTVKCVTSNVPFVYENANFSPYEMKCDVDISNYVYADSQAQLALATLVASASAEVNPNGQADSLLLGSLGFFDWSPTAAIVAPTAGTATVVRTNVLLKDEQTEWDPSAQVFVTLFSFTNAQGARSLSWDPQIGVNAASQYDVNTNSNGSSAGAVVALCVAVLFSCLVLLL